MQVVQAPPPPAPPTMPLDVNFLVSQLGEIIGIITLIVAGALALRWFFRSPIGEAIAEGIRQRRLRRHGEVLDDGRIAHLEEQLERVHGQVGELAERLDFAERMLTRQRAGDRLGPGEPPS